MNPWPSKITWMSVLLRKQRLWWDMILIWFWYDGSRSHNESHGSATAFVIGCRVFFYTRAIRPTPLTNATRSACEYGGAAANSITYAGREQLKQKLRQGLATMHRPQSANPTQNSATIGNHKSEDVLDGSVWSGLAGPSISIPNQNKYQRLHAKVLLHSHVWTFKQFCSASLSKVF